MLAQRLAESENKLERLFDAQLHTRRDKVPDRNLILHISRLLL